MKRKVECLPLKWYKGLTKAMISYLGDIKKIEPKDILISESMFENYFLEGATPTISKKTFQKRIAEKYPQYRVALNRFYQTNNFEENMRDFDCFGNMIAWTRNKNIFQFDSDFMEELAYTENLQLLENSWDYLPYPSFYVDLSQNKKICKSIAGDGFFVTVTKNSAGSRWLVHLCRVDKQYFNFDIMAIANQDASLDVDPKEKEMLTLYSEYGKKEVEISSQVYHSLVIQILNYLSSVKPDIEENEETKSHKPVEAQQVKNQYSEVKKWDVGVRFGNAYRSWQKEQEELEEEENRASHPNGKHTKKRPHSRRGHMHNYWYVENGVKVKRQRWINFLLVNAKKADKIPVTIHAVQ